MRLDAAPERPLGGDLCWVGSDGERRDAEPRKMRLPSGRVGKLLVRVLGETGNDGSGECTFPHIGQGGVIDHVVAVASTQQIEKVQSALAVGGAEPGEIVVADLCADAVSTFVARTGVIHRDPVGGLQAGAQHVTRFG